MKKLLLLLVVIAGVVLYFQSDDPGSSAQKVKAGIASIFSSGLSSGKDYSQELADKQAELKAYEEALKQVDAQIEQWKREAESQICPQTGRPSTFTVTDDPRPKTRKKIDQLQREIAELERKVNQTK